MKQMVRRLKYRSPRPECLKASVWFLENTGYSNPYLHLLTCYRKHKLIAEQERIIQNLFNDAQESANKHGGTIGGFFNIRALSEYDRAIYMYLKLIVSKNLALSIIEAKEFRAVSKYSCAVGIPTLVSVVLQLTKMVE